MNAETKIVAAAQLSALRADIQDAIGANDAAQVDRIDRVRLDGMSERLGGYVRVLDGMACDPNGAALYFGENWHLPAVRDLIESSRAIALVSDPLVEGDV